MADVDSEEEFWASPSASHVNYTPSLPPPGPHDSESESNNDHFSTRKRFKRTSERGVGTSGTATRRPPPHPYAPPARNSAATPFSPRQFSRTNSSSSSGPDNGLTPLSADSDTEDDAAFVEAMVDTESEGSQPPSRGPSFAFSYVGSNNASMTSLSSVDSYDSNTGRKRALEYEDTWTPIAGASGSRKSPRTAQRTSASSSFRPAVPQTPSRSARARQSSAGSQSASQRKPETPTISRISDSLANVGLRTPESARRLDNIRRALESATPSAGASALTPSASASASTPSAGASTSMPSAGASASTHSAGVCVIAHSAEAQAHFDRLNISWAVQYEIARGVSLGWWVWDDVTPYKIQLLQGAKNAVAAKVSEVIRGAASVVSPMDAAIWTELDREEAAIREGRQRGLGLAEGNWMDEANWYGGKIQQVARLEQTDGTFRLVLAKMEMRKSHRFARFLGSRRLLQISVPATLMYERGDALRDFFRQRFVLCGRVFVVLGAKDNKAFLMEIPEDYERKCRVPGDEQRVSLEDFINWHNPLRLPDNANQPVKKYVTRFDLGFSISVPALHFEDAEIYFREDEYVDGYGPESGKKAPAERIYTDGCGYMNGAALCAIARQAGLTERPTAVQGRIAGAKGLWVLHLRDQSPHGTPKIWIRKSQVKIQLDLNNLHPAHRIFDLLAPPRVSVPSRLSRLTILNLSHNGVPNDVFVELMRDTLDAEVNALTDWSGPMTLLSAAVDRAGGVTMKRIMQYAQGTTRATGLTGRIRENDSEQDDELIDPKLADMLQDMDQGEMPSVKSLRDPITGEPLSIHGTVMDLLQAGFHPMKLQMLYDKLKKIVTDVIEGIIKDFHISVPLSAEAFIVPDPYNVLKEGEIHFKSTKDLKDPVEYSQPHIILGEVLIYRNPCRLPSDVRKVTAVQCDKLAEYTNVIVLPTVGPCSYASILAGGDYDGDTCVCIYDPRIVEPFTNSEIFTAPENFLKDNFEDQGTIQQVSALTAEMDQKTDPVARRRKLQEALLCGLITAPIGQYSSFHENAIYMHGYDDPETVRMAFMFNTILDSRKTGHVVKEEVRKRDKRDYDKEQPECLKPSKSTQDTQSWSQSGLRPLKRRDGLGPFVLDELLKEGRKMGDQKLRQYDELVTFRWREEDPELVAPFDRVRSLMRHEWYKDDLALIKEHIDKHIEMWRAIAGESRAPKTPSRRGRAAAPVGKSGKSTRALWDELSRSFAAGPEISKDSPFAIFAGDLELLKASWAYSEKPKFAWKVAFQALCRMKASPRQPIALTSEFADVMSISSAAVRVLQQSRQAPA